MNKGCSEGKKVFIPEQNWEGGWRETGGNKAGNKLYTRVNNAAGNLRKNVHPSKGRVVEYKLVPTGNYYDSNGDLIDVQK